VTILDYKTTNKTQSIVRDLPKITILPSYIWIKLRAWADIVVINLIFFAVVPYFLSYSNPFSVFLLCSLWLALHFLYGIYSKNKLQPQNIFTHISVKNGIWSVHSLERHNYCELRSAILCWQWIVIIPLYCPQTRTALRLILPKDSLSPADNAVLRRWLRSEFV